MTLDSYFPLFGGFVNKNCVLGECWALSYFFDRARTQPKFSFLPFDNDDPISALAPRELRPSEQPQGQAAAGAEPVLLPAVAALPHLCATSPKSRSSAEPQESQKYWKLQAVGTLQGKGEGLAESRAGCWGQQCCLCKKCL